MDNRFKITQTAPTVAALMGLELPSGFEPVNSVVYEKAMAALPTRSRLSRSSRGKGQGRLDRSRHPWNHT